MNHKKKIRIQIMKNENNKFIAITDLHETIENPHIYGNLLEIQSNYTKLIKALKNQLNVIQKSRKNRGNSILKWKLADSIFRFLKSLELKGFVLENISKTLSRDLGISPRYVNYLIEFRSTYPDIKMIHPEISWDKYKELLDIPVPHLRNECIKRILSGELKTRNDVRLFKKSLRFGVLDKR